MNATIAFHRSVLTGRPVALCSRTLGLLPLSGALGDTMPETILIVGDEESVRNSLAGVMRAQGYEVVTVASARWIGDQKPLEVPE